MANNISSVGIKATNWTDGMRVDKDDMVDEQSRNQNIDAANINNFFSSGVLSLNETNNVILDTDNLNSTQQSLLTSNLFDGQNVYDRTNTVSDTINGVQLAITMSNVALDGYATTKIAIFGDTFGGDFVSDELTFEYNGTQITKNRYKKIRSILFNNFAGNQRGSKSFAMSDGYLSGRCLITEVDALQISPDTIMASQTAQPSQFYGNFLPADFLTTTNTMLDVAIKADDSAKSISDLDIGLASFAKRELVANDVTTQIGQKFLAQGTNIQKISVLLSVKYDATDGYDFSGNINLSLYELQTDVDCPVSPIPDDAVDFDPDPRTLAQLSLSAADLRNQGVILDGYAQVVDFVLTNTNISDPSRSPITDGNYYLFTISRSGDTSTGTIQIEEATHRTEYGYMTVYNGSVWTNVKESDMWYAVYGDYAKITDGVAYTDGVGIEVPRVQENSLGVVEQYVEKLKEFSTVTRDAYNYVIMDKTTSFSDPTQNQRTGNSVSSRARPVPNFSLINSTNLTTLLSSNPLPLLLGCIRDRNPRGNLSSVTGTTETIGLARRNQFNILYPGADLLQHNWNGSLLIPNSTSCCATYRIIKTEIFADAYGDVNGDGVIDNTDITYLQSIRQSFLTYSEAVLGAGNGTSDIDLSTSTVQQFIADGYVDIEDLLRADVNGDGIINGTDEGLINNYVDKDINSFSAGSTFPRIQFTVENLTNPETTSAVIPTTCSSLSTVPFVSVPWRIDYFATWSPGLLFTADGRRKLATTISDGASGCNGGQNNFYVPGDLLIEGNLKNPDGTIFANDFEMTHLSLHIPITDAYGASLLIDGYSGILLFDTFVAESSGGQTSSRFNAMKYFDGTYVQPSDFASGKVKISASLQSTSTSFNSPFGSSIDNIVGLNYEPSTSLMTLYLADGYEALAIPAIRTKVLIEVYLKKAGFQNATQSITDDEVRALLGL